MTQRRLLALLAAFPALGLSACGTGLSDKPAHRPVSIVYVAGDQSGPWADRTAGLLDGAKLAVAERHGVAGERAVSVALAPPVQRAGNQSSAAIGAGRILKDSTALAVLGVYSAPELALSAPQFNGAELGLIQFGTGMRGLLAAELRGEPQRYEPSGAPYAVRGLVPDDQVAGAARNLLGRKGVQVVQVRSAYDAALRVAATERTKRAAATLADARKAGKTGDDLPGTSPELTAPSSEVPDATRLATQITQATGGDPQSVDTLSRAAPTALVIDPSEPDPTEWAQLVASRVSGPLVIIDGADRTIDARALAGRSAPTYVITRPLADAETPRARDIRARERKVFGRDRADAVVAGYLATIRMLDLVRAQPETTIERRSYAAALTADAAKSTGFPVAEGQSQLATLQVSQLRGRRWVPAR